MPMLALQYDIPTISCILLLFRNSLEWTLLHLNLWPLLTCDLRLRELW